jgi:hypothetical protein
MAPTCGVWGRPRASRGKSAGTSPWVCESSGGSAASVRTLAVSRRPPFETMKQNITPLSCLQQLSPVFSAGSMSPAHVIWVWLCAWPNRNSAASRNHAIQYDSTTAHHRVAEGVLDRARPGPARRLFSNFFFGGSRTRKGKLRRRLMIVAGWV